MSLDAAHQAFAAGNYREARRLAESLKDAPDEATREAARIILMRTGHDKAILYLAIACVVFFVVVVGLTWR